jgi:hypothetical protein
LKRNDALLIGVAWGSAIAVIAYALARVTERVLFPEPNPAMLLWADHSPFTWRVCLAVYIGGAGVFGGFAAARRSGPASARVLRALVGGAILGLLVQGVLWP